MSVSYIHTYINATELNICIIKVIIAVKNASFYHLAKSRAQVLHKRYYKFSSMHTLATNQHHVNRDLLLRDTYSSYVASNA